ncbi:MAG: hypothetical protein ACHQFW_10835, partial [Chitinophagales bacterium]
SMLDSLITSRTRVKLLLKFFSNSKSSGHLRGLAKEMHESTNAIRLELNKLSKAGFLLSREEGKTIQYTANEKHPLFPEVSSLVRKYLGLDKVVENIVNQIGEIKYAFIIGDYAEGKDTGIIELVIVGEVDLEKLNYWVNKTETLISRKVNTDILSDEDFNVWKLNGKINNSIVLWTSAAVE